MDFSRIETMFSDNSNHVTGVDTSSEAKVTSASTESFPAGSEVPPTLQDREADPPLNPEKAKHHPGEPSHSEEMHRSSSDGSVYNGNEDACYNNLDSTESTEEQVGCVSLFGTPIVSLFVEGTERLCLAQISNTILRDFSYNEIHNRRVALGITCVQCSPSQLEVLRRAGAMPMSSRRCGLITRRESERLVKSFIEEVPPPRLPEDFAFKVVHYCGWGSKGLFYPARYNSSRAKCIKCVLCETFFSPNKFIFHYHKRPGSSYQHPDAANFNSWRRHLNLEEGTSSESLLHTWEDVKAMFNGGCRKRFSPASIAGSQQYTPPHSAVDSDRSRSCLSYGGPLPPMATKYQQPFPASSVKAHPAFSNRLFGNIAPSYGDLLRTLSLPYNMWSSVNNGCSLAYNPTATMAFNPFQGQNCVPVNSSVPVPRIEWSDPRFLPPSGVKIIEDNLVSDNPIADYGIGAGDGKDEDLHKSPPPANSNNAKFQEVKSQSCDRETKDVPEQTEKSVKILTVPKNDTNHAVDKGVGNQSSESDRFKGKVTQKEEATDFPNNLSQMSVDKLREAIHEEKVKRATVDKEHKRMKNILRLRALKELELREEYARQLSSVKENIWSEIEEERQAKRRLEDELKETQQLLQRLSQQMHVGS